MNTATLTKAALGGSYAAHGGFKSTSTYKTNNNYNNNNNNNHTVQAIKAKLNAQKRASDRNRRLAMQMGNRPSVQAALKLKKRSIKQRVGVVAGRGGAAGVGVGGGGANRSLNASFNKNNSAIQNNIRKRLGGAILRGGRGALRGGGIGFRTRGAKLANRNVRARLGGNVNNSGKSALRKLNAANRINRGGAGVAKSNPNSRNASANRLNLSSASNGSFKQRFNDNRGGSGNRRGGRRGGARGMRGGRGGNNKKQQAGGVGGGGQQASSREALDNDLDQYMSKSKTHLNSDLDAYMAH